MMFEQRSRPIGKIQEDEIPFFGCSEDRAHIVQTKNHSKLTKLLM
jgi:hypothetical protein